MTAVLFEPENIQVKYNITNINPSLIFFDVERFFLRSEEKYGLQEINLEKMDFNFSMDYSLVTIPPIFADKGTFRFYCEDASFNSVWRMGLNTLKNFFEIKISHILFQINPDKFEVELDSYSDMTHLIN